MKNKNSLCYVFVVFMFFLNSMYADFNLAPTTGHVISYAHGRNFNATTTRSIETNALPTASFSYSCNGLVCDFDATNSADSDGSISSYEWSFGSTGVTARHTYTSTGFNSASLTVTDNAGATSLTSRLFDLQVINISHTRSPTENIVHWSSNDPSITRVNVYRNGVIVGSDTSGSWLDNTASIFLPYRYKVCKAGSTTICSQERRIWGLGSVSIEFEARSVIDGDSIGGTKGVLNSIVW